MISEANRKIQNVEHSAIQLTQFLQEVNYLRGERGGEGQGHLFLVKRHITANYNIRTIFGS